jgi:hypothetical protein
MPRHRWTEEEREILRRDYRHNRQSAIEIGNRLGIDPDGVKAQASYLGIAKRTDHNPWTPEDKEKLARLIGKMSYHDIARHMHRSYNAVCNKAYELRANIANRENWYTKRDICRILGVDHHWIDRRIKDGRIKGYQVKDTNKRPSIWRITAPEVKRFIQKYPHEFTGRNVDLVQIVALLSSVRTGWTLREPRGESWPPTMIG